MFVSVALSFDFLQFSILNFTHAFILDYESVCSRLKLVSDSTLRVVFNGFCVVLCVGVVCVLIDAKVFWSFPFFWG